MAQGRRARLASRISVEDRTAFDRDGFVVRRDALSAAAFAALVEAVRAYRGPIREKTEGRTLLRKITVTPKLIERMPALAAVQESPLWQGLIRYAGSRDAEPGMFIQGVLQQAADGEDDPQTFVHADTFHPTVKAWLFLTDVEQDEGPFTYVPGSHRLTPARLAWERAKSLTALQASDLDTRQGSFRITPAELEALGLPPPVSLAVPANTLVVADTFGFHARGRSARPSTRVEIWGNGRRNPFLPWTGLDRLVGAVSLVAQAAGDWRTRSGGSIFDPADA